MKQDHGGVPLNPTTEKVQFFVDVIVFTNYQISSPDEVTLVTLVTDVRRREDLNVLFLSLVPSSFAIFY